MPLGNIFSIAFFVILFVAAITSAISMLEVVVAYFMEELKMSRRAAVIVTCVIVAILGSLSSLPQGTLKDYTLFGKSIFDIFDYTTSNIMLPVGGLFIVLFVGWKMKRSDVLDELTSGGTIPFKRNILDVTMFCIKFLAPVAISFVLLNSIGLIKFF
jgi:NSS family neurotransmitter:Na+ symporter